MIRVKVRVQPGSSRDEIADWREGTLRLRLRARAVEGKANTSMLEFLADRLGLRPYQLSLVRGDRSREKLVQIDLDSLEEMEGRLGRP